MNYEYSWKLVGISMINLFDIGWSNTNRRRYADASIIWWKLNHKFISNNIISAWIPIVSTIFPFRSMRECLHWISVAFNWFHRCHFFWPFYLSRRLRTHFYVQFLVLLLYNLSSAWLCIMNLLRCVIFW